MCAIVCAMETVASDFKFDVVKHLDYIQCMLFTFVEEKNTTKSFHQFKSRLIHT